MYEREKKSFFLRVSKIKNFLPSLKEKRRYIVYELLKDKMENISINDVNKAIKSNLLRFLGELGYAKASPMFINDIKNKAQNKGIIRISNRFIDEVRTGISLVKEINGNKVLIRTIGISGILKKAKQRYLSS